ncbi:nuclear transport factor 2 family protein [Aliiroseovarius sp. PrR006]|uniref:nuclear transport factor 2 family protein n=1 Tax=Aliiroseovarius sp. PrR006 TaxID=2706883 RepID=UPI0013D4A8AA|nr:nuclear transport factor 2 family protein [Aliiroseovarius sp. PrR006]NDW52802.1 nuclear transport factor 2 family protein [Aliiroseovarius sp. PrR006]
MLPNPIEDAVDAYIRATTRGLAEELADIFHENFTTAGLHGGQMQWFDRETIIEFCVKNAQPENDPLPVWSILHSNVFETTAYAVVESKLPNSTFTEVLTFFREAERWRVAFKSFETRME